MGSRRGADLRFPFGAGFGEEITPDEAGAAAVGAMDDDDIEIRETKAWIGLLEEGIIPFFDSAEVDFGQGFRSEREVTGDTGQVDDRDNGADDGWKKKILVVLRGF